MKIKTQIRSMYAFSVIGLKYRGANPQNEILQLWREFMLRLPEIPNIVDGEVSYGVMGKHDQATGEFDYLAAVEVHGSGETPQGLERWEIPEQSYAVFTFAFHAIQSAYQYAFGKWLEESGHTRADGTDFERYSAEFDPANPSSEMEYWMPIVAKPED